MAQKRDIAQEFLDRVWRHEDVSAIYEMFSGAASIQGLEEVDQIGPDEFRAFHRMMTAQFSDIRHTILLAVEDGPWLAILCDITAVYRKDGTKVATRSQIMMRHEGDKIVEAHNQLSLIPIFEAIGRLPPRTLDLCLLGTKLEVQRKL